MRQLLITLVAITALLAGFYLSARYYSEPIAAPEAVLEGELLGNFRPDFQLGSNAGEFVTPEDFPGKIILINFWATWCAPCRREIPLLKEFQARFNSISFCSW